jgi:hypothetical protein
MKLVSVLKRAVLLQLSFNTDGICTSENCTQQNVMGRTNPLLSVDKTRCA